MTGGAFRVTFDVTTPESAEFGDYAESGFINAAGDKVAALIGAETPSVGVDLATAVRLAGGCMEDSGHWFSEIDGRTCYATGAVERRSIHPPRNVTGASYGRLKRLLSC